MPTNSLMIRAALGFAAPELGLKTSLAFLPFPSWFSFLRFFYDSICSFPSSLSFLPLSWFFLFFKLCCCKFWPFFTLVPVQTQLNAMGGDIYELCLLPGRNRVLRHHNCPSQHLISKAPASTSSSELLSW